MEKHSMFMVRKNQYRENGHTTQSNLQIQRYPRQAPDILIFKFFKFFLCFLVIRSVASGILYSNTNGLRQFPQGGDTTVPFHGWALLSYGYNCAVSDS